MGKHKDKGSRFERELTSILNDNNIKATKQILSGAHKDFPGDVILDDTKELIECKHRENISKQFWEWLEGNTYLAIKRNYKKTLIVMDLEEFIKLKGENSE